ncbi:TolB family protein, partial [Gemmatimonadota bacterium]
MIRKDNTKMDQLKRRVGCLVGFLLISSCATSSCEKNPTNPKIYPPIVWDVSPSWALTNEWIAYEHSAISLNDTSGIYIIRPDGTGRRLVFSGGRSPDWSPNGVQIVSNFSLDYQLYLTDCSTGVNSAITDDAMFKAFPSWHPGGEEILFSVPVGSQELAGIWRFNPSTEYMVRIILNEGIEPQWDPSGMNIVTIRKSSSWLSIWNLADSTFVDLISSNNLNGTILKSPSISPDGGRIAFHTAQSNKKEPIIWIYSLNTKKVESLVRGGWFPSWNPDGTEITFTRGRFFEPAQEG